MNAAAKSIAAMRSLYRASPETEFAEAARSRGLSIFGPAIGDGVLHRVAVEGDKRGSRNGWYLLHLDGVPAGAFGSWKGGWRETWRSGGHSEVTASERERLNAAFATAKQQREADTLQRWQQASERALKIWQSATTADPLHPYLARKSVQAHGIRQLGDQLLVPMRDANGVLWNLQTISADGFKLFQKGARKTGTYHAIGGPVVDVLNITEGYATGASIYAATSQPVAIAFDCGNLTQVARVLRAKYLQARITLCADNDIATPGNPGLTKAKMAAAAIGGRIAIPPDGFNDFNDAAREMRP